MNSENYAFLNDNLLKYISICFVDTNGQLRSKLVSKDKVIRSTEFNGKGFTIALPSIALGFNDLQSEIMNISSEESSFGDIPAKIDLNSFRKVPWLNQDQNVICMLELDNQYNKFCTRSICRKIISEANEKDLFSRFGFEFEFTLLDENSISAANKSYNNLQTSTINSSYNLLHRQHQQSDLYSKFCENADIMNIEIEAWHEEMGPGFMEVATASGQSIKNVDDAVLVKHLIKQTTMRFDKLATFMARWNDQSDGQSGHIHISLENKNKENLFLKNNKDFFGFIGGLQKFSPEFMIFFAPNNNSFKRLQPGYFSPQKNDWDWENRKMAFRAINGKNKRIENRIPGSDINPYLALSATIVSGLEGINQQLEASKPKIGKQLPKELIDACKKLKKSYLAKNKFGEEFISLISDFKLNENFKQNNFITDIEKKHYLEFS